MRQMSKKTQFCYYDASGSTTLPAGAGQSSVLTRSASSVRQYSEGEPAIALSGVVVKVAAGAGDKCVAPSASRPKRRTTICQNDDDDTLNVQSIQWISAAEGISVCELASTYHTQFPLLAKVTEDCADFVRGQVHL